MSNPDGIDVGGINGDALNAGELCDAMEPMVLCDQVAEATTQPQPLTALFFSSHGNSSMATVERIQQILTARQVPYESVDLSDQVNGGVEDAWLCRERMEGLSGGQTETPQLHIRGRFIGAGSAALEELMYLIDSGQDLNQL
eukprot:TRINITY_DN3439_c0_g2_i11.p2 TRINITY_DN3439_c0_g2~~TRINITY_DN3439_c0_g2_i11.p2  ORF type:complete len:142 (+),score=30.29 TRINITY_DN3439_c0_g2_i11:207-632(+)